ncbi:MAG: bifunctional methylenetetrahydrofolate dehydrogenase/methenyltetrahydrofolate cyclohydrolase FolD [Thermaerobacterales bacterium]
MAALVLDGKSVARQVRRDLRRSIANLREAENVTPGLGIILIGDDPASEVYVRTKLRACERAGIQGTIHRFPAEVNQESLEARIRELNQDHSVHGMLIQWPVPSHLDFASLIDRLAPVKDVDGFHPINAGRLLEGRPRFVPATPLGILRLLTAYNIECAGMDAVIVGRSRIVGRPMGALLLNEHATVTLCHSRTHDLASHVRRADLLIVAAGRPRMIRGDMIKPGAVVVDVGINRVNDGLVGDIDYESVVETAGAVTPVPGGVGPMTVAMLLHNTFEAAKWITQGSLRSVSLLDT